MSDAEIRERLARLETRMDLIAPKIDDMHNAFQQGKGAWWLLMGAVSALASLLTAAMFKLIPYVWK